MNAVSGVGMRRFVVLTIFVVGSVLVGVRESHADIPPAVVDCSVGTATLQYCLATPAPTTLPTHSPINPIKSLAVGAGVQAPSGIVQYPVTVTSSLVCFSLTEPIDLSAMGPQESSVFVPIDPAGTPAASFYKVVTNPVTGQAQLQLEVKTAVVGAAGLNVKAVWPAENKEQIQSVIAAGPPTPTPTGQPPPPTPTSTSTSTPTPTGTPLPTPTATATSTTLPPTFTVAACTTPSRVTGLTLNNSGDATTIYGHTTPGAICTSSVNYFAAYDFPDYGDKFVSGIQGPKPNEFDGSAQVAASDGLVIYPLTVSTTADFGIATVTCSLAGAPAPKTGCTAFFITQANTAYLQTLNATDLFTLVTQLARNHCPVGTFSG